MPCNHKTCVHNKPTTQGKSLYLNTASKGDKLDVTNTFFSRDLLWILRLKQSTLIWLKNFQVTPMKETQICCILLQLYCNNCVPNAKQRSIFHCKTKNQKPQFFILDNEASNTIKVFLLNDFIHCQLLPSLGHRVDVTVRNNQ